MKISHKYGVYVDNYEEFREILNSKFSSKKSLLMLNSTLLNNTQIITDLKSKKGKKFEIIVKDLVSKDLCDLIVTQSSNLQIDFLLEYTKLLKKVKEIEAKGIVFSIDLSKNFDEKRIFITSINSFCYQNGIDFELNLRVPELDMSPNYIVNFKNNLKSMMINANIALDLHLNENEFLQMDYEKIFNSILFDVKSIHFQYDKQFGNKLDTKLQDKLIMILGKYNTSLNIIN